MNPELADSLLDLIDELHKNKNPVLETILDGMFEDTPLQRKIEPLVLDSKANGKSNDRR